ncbi:MAG TPA: gamma-glutamyltransferase [Anaerolineae bacterium]|nr:gamma-glutamyltransferase [Anaerolineae bacterium]HOQ97542.1 gamma-glutamyltransferase [Anaerolineae bacterium]
MAWAFHSHRSVVMANRGMVATSQPLAAQAGLRVLQEGGNAIDAAVTAAAVLGVVEPMSTGVGGDAFALLYLAKEGRVRALNASGRAPLAATAERMAALCRRGRIPSSGPLTVTVPGAVSAWEALLQAHGTRSLAEALAPAIGYAREGYPVSEVIGRQWAQLSGKLRQDNGAAATYLVQGKAPRIGQVFRQPDLARTLEQLAAEGSAALYRGELAQRITAYVQAKGGLLTAEDLTAHTPTWETPIEVTYRGHRLLECPPNGQGIAALQALGILEGSDLGSMRWGFADTLHLQIEAIKLAFADALRYVADPCHAAVPADGLLEPGYLARRRALLDPRQANPSYAPGLPGAHADTVYLTVVDEARNAVSFISSLYEGFGSGLVVPGTGIALQNRGALFALDPAHPNCVAPGKRPYHTIIPALLLAGQQLVLSFGVMGGYMQPQGQVQVLGNLLDWGMDVQQALDAPRFRWVEGNEVAFEAGLSHMARLGLEKLGHSVTTNAAPATMGGGQIIRIDPESGVLQGGSDPRKDGCAVGF